MSVDFWESLSSGWDENGKSPREELLEFWAKGEETDEASHTLEGGVWNFDYIFAEKSNG